MKDTGCAPVVPVVVAEHCVRRMRGGSGAMLCKASDGHHYVVKLLHNAQGRRCIVNDYFVSLLAREIGLPVPEVALVEVRTEFLNRSWASPKQRQVVRECNLNFGSRVPVDPNVFELFDYWPRRIVDKITNAHEVPGCWLFDLWTANADGFQYVVHWQTPGSFRFWKIDHGFCLTGDRWEFENIRSIPSGWLKAAMQRASAVNDLNPYLSRIEMISLERLQQIAALIPEYWVREDSNEFRDVLFSLYLRATVIEHHARKFWPFGELSARENGATSSVGGTES